MAKKKTHLDLIRPKAIQRRKAFALVREVIKTRLLSRTHNIHATDDGKNVWFCGPIKEVRAVLKHFKSRAKPSHDYTDHSWASAILKVK